MAPTSPSSSPAGRNTAGRLGVVKPNVTRSECNEPRPSVRYVGLNAIVNGSPEKETGRSSSARPTSSAPADSRSTSSANSIRTCAPRSATSATRLIASVSSATPMVATAVCSAGSSCRNFGNSASSNRVVLRLPSLRIPSNPSLPTADPAPNDKCTSPPSAPALAASANVLAGTSTAASMSADSVDQVSSRTANRNRSVAAKTTFSPEISTRIPVSIGSVSSRPAATAT